MIVISSAMKSGFGFLRICALASLLMLAGHGAMANVRLDSPAGQLKWTDSNGAEVKLADFRGTPVIMTMAYTACRRTCSSTMLVLKEMQAILERKGRRARFVIISYDPARDSPRAWTDYRNARGLNYSNWHFLTGTAQNTKRIARFLDLDFWNYDEHVMHDFRIVLFDADGRVKREIVWDRPKDLEPLLADL